jgi:drug/metabolite transporter (DMT)-like permease
LAIPHSESRSLFDRPYLLLTLVALFWAINIVLGRYIAGTIPPVTLSLARWGGASLILLPFVVRHIRHDWPEIRSHFKIMLALTLTGMTLYNTLAYYGLKYTEAINGLLIQSAGPLFIGLVSFVLFRDWLSRGQIAGVLVSLSGVVVIITQGDLAALLTLQLNHGDLWFLLAILIYATYAAMLRLRPPIHPLSFLGFTVIVGALLLVPAAIVESALGYHIKPTPQAFAVMAYMAVFPSILAYLFFNRGVELIGANRAGPFFHLIPVFGSAIAIAFLGERPEIYHAIGYILIICGIIVAQKWAPAAKVDERHSPSD